MSSFKVLHDKTKISNCFFNNINVLWNIYVEREKEREKKLALIDLKILCIWKEVQQSKDIYTVHLWLCSPYN